MKVRSKIKKGLRLIAIVCRQDDGFSIDYHFDSKGVISTVSVKVPNDDRQVESITEDYPSADYYEREIHDFFGVEFVGNINLHLKLFLPDNYKGEPPMLK